MPDYQVLKVDDLESSPAPCRHKKEVDEAVGAAAFGFNVYTADPGEQLPFGYHYHPDHEELFYVIEGTVEFETADDEYQVEEGEVFFVPEGSPQRGRATGDSPARVIAVGAPKESDGAILEELCETCGKATDREYSQSTEDDGLVYVLTCAECGAETDRFHP